MKFFQCRKDLIVVMAFNLCSEYKMNEIVNKVLLKGDKFMLKVHLKQPRFSYSACGLFAKIKKDSKNYRNKKHASYL